MRCTIFCPFVQVAWVSQTTNVQLVSTWGSGTNAGGVHGDHRPLLGEEGIEKPSPRTGSHMAKGVYQIILLMDTEMTTFLEPILSIPLKSPLATLGPPPGGGSFRFPGRPEGPTTGLLGRSSQGTQTYPAVFSHRPLPDHRPPRLLVSPRVPGLRKAGKTVGICGPRGRCIKHWSRNVLAKDIGGCPTSSRLFGSWWPGRRPGSRIGRGPGPPRVRGREPGCPGPAARPG